MRLIDADVIIDDLTTMKSDFEVIVIDDMIRGIENAPTIDVKNFVRYHMDEFSRTIRYQLVEVDTEKPYYPNCGARMTKDGDSECP